MTDFTFTRVAIIESLGPREMKSGSLLKDYLAGLRDGAGYVPDAALYRVTSAREFLETLASLTECAQRNEEHPILHIETHGFDDQSGIVFEDGSWLEWWELASPLAMLNAATGFNLLVCVAACFGGHFLERMRPNGQSPCWALIGPTKLVDPGELLGSFRDFYRELLTTLDGAPAVEALLKRKLGEGRFVVVTAEEWFHNLAMEHLAFHCTQARISERSLAIELQLQKMGRPRPLVEIERYMKEQAKLNIGKFFEAYFMTHQVPRNAERFAETKQQLATAAARFFASQGY